MDNIVTEDIDTEHEDFHKKGRLQFSFEIVPYEETIKDVVGEGRGEPNQNPKLPEPLGRLKFSLNPYTMLK